MIQLKAKESRIKTIFINIVYLERKHYSLWIYGLLTFSKPMRNLSVPV